MFRHPRCLRAFALGIVFFLPSLSNASAHCFVGARFFPATLVIDDPCVADEMSLPTVDWFKTGTSPPGSEIDIAIEFDKRITQDLGFGISDVWSQIRTPGGPVTIGLGNLETTLQYQLLKDASHETGDASGPDRRLGRDRRSNAGIGTPYNMLTPTYYFGQGFGGLRDELEFARPLAVTGQIGYQIPTTSYIVSQGVFVPQVLVYGAIAAIQHALPQIRGEGPSASRFRQSSDSDCRNAAITTPVANNFGNLSISRPARSTRA